MTLAWFKRRVINVSYIKLYPAFTQFFSFLSSGSSYLELILADKVGELNQYNISHVSSQGGNISESQLNRTIMQGAEDFDPLGGHTIWQVTNIHDFASHGGAETTV